MDAWDYCGFDPYRLRLGPLFQLAENPAHNREVRSSNLRGPIKMSYQTDSYPVCINSRKGILWKMMGVKKYSVVILLNEDGSKVLLQKKDRTLFKGKLNGVGGKIEKEEMPVNGALREVLEETSLRPEDLLRFEWIGTLTLPEQCDTNNMDKYPELWFFGGVVKDENRAHKPDTETEEIRWYHLKPDNKPFTDLETAGDGDLEYFIGVARHMFFGRDVASYE